MKMWKISNKSNSSFDLQAYSLKSALFSVYFLISSIARIQAEVVDVEEEEKRFAQKVVQINIKKCQALSMQKDHTQVGNSTFGHRVHKSSLECFTILSI